VETLNVGAWADHVAFTICIVAMAYGIRVGAYGSTALGLRWLGAAFGGFALQESFCLLLESLDVARDVARAGGLVSGAAMLFCGSTLIQRRIEAWQEARVPRLPGPADALLGGGSGLATGWVVSGLVQVVWMMPVIPDAVRIDKRALDWRCGDQLLENYATFIGADQTTIHTRVVEGTTRP